jgi:DNA repair exonuclease SbcCD nuclease subunit
MKLLAFTDAHIRGTTPKSRKDDYPDALWNKCQQITIIIKKYNIDIVLNGGDLFDSADPSTGLVNKYLTLFRSWGIPIYSIVGSHDKFGYNDTTIPRTALGTLVAAGVTKIIDKEGIIINNVQICGVSHSYNLDESPNDYYCKKRASYAIQLCHGMITPQSFFGKYTVVHNIHTEADLVICGHYHPGFHPTKVGNSTIINIGSLGRTERTVRIQPPGVLYINTETKKVNFVPLNVTENPFHDHVKESNQSHVEIDSFIEMLKQKAADLECGNLKELITTVGQEKEYPIEIIEEALKYVED